MIIGFDGKRAVQNKTGLGNYSRFIIRSLAPYARQTKDKLVVFAPKYDAGNLFEKTAALLSDCMDVVCPRSAAFFPSLWRVWGCWKQIVSCHVDLYHGLSNELPLSIGKAKTTRSVVTVHDLIFLRYPRYYHWIDKKIYTYKTSRACRHADRVVAVSECTKRDIVSFFGIDPEKIDVVYQGCDPRFSQQPAPDEVRALKEKYDLKEPFILYVGTIEERKNLLLLLRAMQQLTPCTTLVAIGRRTPYMEKVEAFCNAHLPAGSVKFLHTVPFTELPAFYHAASLFVYPSRYEGFGIPVLEALCSGVPVIAATGSCLEEAGGPSSLYVSPDDPVQLAEAIRKVLTDGELRTRMIRDGREYARRFEEDKLAQDLLAVYKKTIKQPRS